MALNRNVILFVSAAFLLSAVLYFHGPLVPPAHTVSVKCETTKGPLEILVMPEWSPRGAERFLKLVDEGFYNNLPVFRCIDRFICQFGAAAPELQRKAYPAIADDPPLTALREFKTGYVSFAGFAPNTRTTHVFIALEPVKSLGTQAWETPFGYVTESSMQSTVSRFSTTYGDSVDSRKIEAPGGVEYLRQFPQLDSIQSCARTASN